MRSPPGFDDRSPLWYFGVISCHPFCQNRVSIVFWEHSEIQLIPPKKGRQRLGNCFENPPLRENPRSAFDPGLQTKWAKTYAADRW